MATEKLDSLLECEDYTITLWVGFLSYVDLAVDHGHNTITELRIMMLVYMHTYYARYHCMYLLVDDRLESCRA
jgi:hypothetical protein